VRLVRIKVMKTFPEEDQFLDALLLALREDVQRMQTQSVTNEQRLVQVETMLTELTQNVKKILELPTFNARQAAPVQPVQPAQPAERPSSAPVEAELFSDKWNYFIAQRGGYNTILRITIQELLKLGDDPVHLLTFLIQTRQREIAEQLRQLQEEYQRLQGTQLQQHFRELWKSHYVLLKKKKARNWKEEIFLAAFDAFIAWLQQ